MCNIDRLRGLGAAPVPHEPAPIIMNGIFAWGPSEFVSERCDDDSAKGADAIGRDCHGLGERILSHPRGGIARVWKNSERLSAPPTRFSVNFDLGQGGASPALPSMAHRVKVHALEGVVFLGPLSRQLIVAQPAPPGRAQAR